MPQLDGISWAPAHPRGQLVRPVDRGRLKRRFLASLAVAVMGLGFVGMALARDAQTVTQLGQVLPPGHYLVLFQNNAELRPSGGFIGSFATVDLHQRGYSNLRIDTNIYKRDNAFAAAHVVTPPQPLLGVAANNAWTMRDSNWDIDFRDAAERVSWFYLQEAGEPVDGVIAVNATVLQDLLRITGPISLGSDQQQLTAENFFDMLAYKIEKEYFYDPKNRTRNEPKTILKDLVPTLKDAALKPTVVAKLRTLVEQELAERQIQLYHTNPQTEEAIMLRGWGGTLRDTDQDYLLVNNASVGGQKSSLRVRQHTTIALRSEGGQTLHRVTIDRTHTGDGVWPDHTNNNYMRLAVPPTAELITLTKDGVNVLPDVDIESTRGKTVFGIHADTEPGKTSQVVAQYLTRGKSSSFLYQKQSGVVAETLTVRADDREIFSGMVTTDKYIDLP